MESCAWTETYPIGGLGGGARTRVAQTDALAGADPNSSSSGERSLLLELNMHEIRSKSRRCESNGLMRNIRPHARSARDLADISVYSFKNWDDVQAGNCLDELKSVAADCKLTHFASESPNHRLLDLAKW